MEKIVLSRHTVIPPSSFQISTKSGGKLNDVAKRDFSLPDNFVDNIARSRPVLQFIVTPRSDDVVLGAWINPKNSHLVQSEEIGRWLWPKGPRHDQALWTAPPLSRANYKKGKNDLYFKVWKGEVRLMGLILWYQRRITVPPQG